jgi:hypothetical protein
VAIAILPLAAAALAIVARHPHIDWADDRALTELAVREAARGHQLLGIGGRFGWRHPGPLWIYLLLPAYELTGHAPWSLSVGAVAVHVAMIGITVAAARRVGGVRGAAVVTMLVTAYLALTGLLYWTNLWAGYAFTFPLLALLLVAVVATSDPRSGWAIPVSALLGTLLVQTDVSLVIPVGGLILVAAGMRLRRFGWRRFLGRGRSAHLIRPAHAAPGLLRSSAGEVVAPSAALGLALVAACWVPPLVQELTTRPGNLTLLLRFGRQGAGGYPLRTALGAVGAALSVVPFGARWVLRDGVQRHLGAGPWWAVTLTVGYLVALSVAAGVAWRRGRRAAGDLAALSVVSVLAAVVAMSRVDGPINFYLLTWVSVLPVGGLAALVLALAPGPLEGQHRPYDRLALGALSVAAILSLGLVLREGTSQNWDRRRSADVAAETAAVERALGSSAAGLVRIHVVTPDTWTHASGVALQLERAGARIEVDPGWVFLFGDAFAPRAAEPSADLYFARPHELPDLAGRPGVVDVARVDGVDVLARRP